MTTYTKESLITVFEPRDYVKPPAIVLSVINDGASSDPQLGLISGSPLILMEDSVRFDGTHLVETYVYHSFYAEVGGTWYLICKDNLDIEVDEWNNTWMMFGLNQKPVVDLELGPAFVSFDSGQFLVGEKVEGKYPPAKNVSAAGVYFTY